MSVEIRVPALGESVTEAVIGRWLKKEGDQVGLEEAIVELETDKVNMEVAAEEAGVIESIVQKEGATVNVGDVLAMVSPVGAAAGAAIPPAPVNSAASAVASAPVDTAPVQNTAPSNGAAAATGSDGLATPVASRLAAEHGIDLAAIQGTGPRGRVTKEDVEIRLATPSTGSSTTSPLPPPPVIASSAANGVSDSLAALFAPARREERQRLSRRRQTIARRLVEAQQTAAMLTTFNEVDMSSIMELRKRRRDAFKERYGVGLGFMSFFTKAVVSALKAFPRLNAEIQGDEIVLKKHYDIGIAVGADEGLVVPVLRDADAKSFAQIESEIGELAGRARANKLTIAELQGGTFTITNGGTFGSLLSTPILNTPEVGILGMHKIEERPIVVKGEIVVRPMMYLALSYDHRIVDGSEAVRFLVRVKELLEDPEALLLEG